MKLSIFQGGFTRDAAFAIAGASINGLSSLVNKSLLRHNNESGRYDLHELIRQYSFAKLRTRTEILAETSSTHALHYAEWLAVLEPRLKSPEQRHIARLIRSETANWIASYHWTIENQRLDILRKMSPCLNWYLEIHGYYDDALGIINAALTKFRSLGAPQSLKSKSDKSAFAFLLNQVGWFEFRKGNVQEGSALFTESLEIAQNLNDLEILYYIHVNWGYLSNFTGEFIDAEQYTAKSLEYARKLTPWHHAVSLSSLGIAMYNLGKLDQAYQQFKEGLDIWRSIGDPRGLCYCNLHMGLVTLALNGLEETETIMQESNEIAASNNDRWSYAFGLDILGLVALTRGQYEEALIYFEEGKSHVSEIGDRFVLLYFTVHKAQAYIGLGSNKKAKQLLQEAYKEAVRSNWILIILNALVSYLEIKNELPARQKLAVSLAVLEHPGINPEIYDRAVCIRDKSLSRLKAQQAGLAEQWAKEKNAEEWAKELLS
jgi:tetratricopeptide (TPR) repeat protein